MKATGIVRRIDDLGRVVIPKEIRRAMRIREGDPLEIYTDTNGCVIFRKYTYLDTFKECKTIAQTINKVTGIPCCIIDRDTVLTMSGIHSVDMVTKHISSDVCDILDGRRQWISEMSISILENIEIYHTQHIFPVFSDGDVVGAIILMCGYGEITEKDIAVCNSMAQLIGLQSET